MPTLAHAKAVKLDANGAGQEQAGPVPVGQRWLIERITVTTTPASPKPKVLVYRGDPDPTNFLDGTRSGDMDVSEYPNPLVLESAESLTAVWSGGTAGATGVVRLGGRVELVRGT